MKAWFLGHLAWILYQVLSWTWKLSIHEPPEMKQRLADKEPFLLAHWHGDELPLIQLARRYRIATLASNSADGSIMTVVLKRLGASVSRGSSSRNAVSGFIGLLKLIKKGHNASFAVDGPKGPVYKVKPGVVETSKKLRIPIFCAGISSNRAWVFEKSWNKAYLPKPFAKIHIRWHGPIQVPQFTDPQDETLYVSKVESQLYAAKQQAGDFIADSQSHC